MSKVKALHTCFVDATGSGPVLLNEGEEHASDSPLVQARPDLFTAPVEEKRPILSRKAKAEDG